MSELSRGELLDCYAEQYFGEHQIFRVLADKIQDNSFFITGATGLFGSWMMAFLHWTVKRKFAEPKVAILTRSKIRCSQCWFDVIEGDIKDFQLGRTAFDYFIHLAAPTAQDTYQGMKDLEKFDMLSIGTRRVLDYAMNLANKRVLIASSGAVFGGFDKSRIDPILECDDSTFPYDSSMPGLGLGKKVAEFITNDYCVNGLVDASIARCFSFVGPGLPTDLHYAIGNFVSSAVNGEDIIIKGDGSNIRSYMYLGDMVSWLMRILFMGKQGEDYNVGSDEKISVLELAKIVKNTLKTTSKIVVLGNTNEAVGTPPNHFYVPNTQKAQKELGLDSYSDLATSIADYASYVRQMRGS